MRVCGETNTHAGILGGFGRPHPQSSDLSCLPCVLAPGEQGAWGTHDVLLLRTRSRPGRGRCAAVKKETPQKSQRFRGARVSPASEGRGGLALVVLVPGSREPGGHPDATPRALEGLVPHTSRDPNPRLSAAVHTQALQRTMALFPSGSQLVGGRVLWAWRGGVRAGAGRRWARGQLPWKHGGIQNVFLHCTSSWKKDRKC